MIIKYNLREGLWYCEPSSTAMCPEHSDPACLLRPTAAEMACHFCEAGLRCVFNFTEGHCHKHENASASAVNYAGMD